MKLKLKDIKPDMSIWILSYGKITHKIVSKIQDNYIVVKGFHPELSLITPIFSTETSCKEYYDKKNKIKEEINRLSAESMLQNEVEFFALPHGSRFKLNIKSDEIWMKGYSIGFPKHTDYMVSLKDGCVIKIDELKSVYPVD